MKTILNRRSVAFLATGATLAMATLVGGSSSTQVKELNPLVVPRTAHAATALTDGRILITGGRDSAGNIVAVSEIFDPASNTSTASATLTTPRVDHTATLLPNGKVLVAGGTGASGSVNSAEIFDPSNPVAGFRVISSTMGAARARHTATLLNSGKVLIAGGDDAGTAEIFDPATESFSSALLAMAAPRIGHTATLFSDDSVLLAGGNTDSMELFTPTDQKFTLDLHTMSAVRTGHEAIELSGTRLLFFEGDTGNTIDEFNPSADTLALEGSMDGTASSATLLANGKILVLGPDAAGLYAPDAADPSAAFTAFDETSVPGSDTLRRSGQTATELSGDKRILVAGGVNALNLSVNPALFNAARIWTDKDDYAPGESVILSGSGWKPNENVDLFAVDSQTEAWTYGSTAPADANGGFVVNPYFMVQLVQQGASFHVTSVGEQSAMQADVTFTDAADPTSTVVSCNPNPVAVGGSTTCTATVTNTKNGSNNNGSPAGTVAFTRTGAAGTFTGSPATLVAIAGSNPAASSCSVTFNATATGTANITGTYTSSNTSNTGWQNSTSAALALGVYGTATKLSFSQQPTSAAAGASIAPAITVQVQDANGTLVANSTASIGMAIGTNPSGGTLSGTTSVSAVAGVATFSNLSINNVGTGYTLQATSTGLTSVTSNAFNITLGAATQVRVETAVDGSGTVVPAQNINSGSSITVYSISRDAGGNFVANVAADSWSYASNTGGVVAGDLVPAGNKKSAVFTGHAAGTAAIHAAVGALSADSGTLTVVGGTTASKLVFTSSPVTTTAGVASGTITVQRQDTSGNPVTTEAARTVTLSSNSTGTVTFTPASPSIPSGSSSVNFTYTDTKAGTPIITAASTSPTAITSATQTETVNAAAASKLAFTTQPANAAAGSVFGTQPVIKTQDTFGNNSTVGLAASSNVTVALTAGTGPLQGTVTLNIGTGAGNGTVTYTNLRIDVPGTDKQLTATSSTGLTSTLSSVFTVVAGAVDHFIFDTISSPQTTGTPFPITITAKDSFGNTVTAFDGGGNKVTLTSTGALTGAPITSNAFTLGVLTQSVTITNAGNFNITATGPGAVPKPTGTSNSFDVNAPCTSPSVTLNPANQTAAYGDASATFSATASGSPVPTVQWQVSTNSGGTFSNIGGATSTTLTINNPTVTMSGNQYRAVFTNSCTPATATSSAATLTVTKAHLTVTADDQFKTFDGNPFTGFTAKITGFVGTDTLAVVSGSPDFTGSAVSAVNYGTYTITPTLGTLSAANYDFTPFVNGTLTIGKAHLKVTADNKSKTFDGNPFTAFTATITGFISPDTIAVVSGSPGFTGSAVGAVNYGTYTITPNVGTLSAANYDFTPFVNGTLTIGKATPNVTVTGGTFPYDGNQHAATATAVGTDGHTAVSGSFAFTYTPPGDSTAPKNASATPYAVTADFTSSDPNYGDASGSGSITINKRPVTVTPDSGQFKIYGNPDPVLIYKVTSGSVVGGDSFSGALSHDPGSNVGLYDITQGTLSLGSNYDLTVITGVKFEIKKRPVTVTPDSGQFKIYGNSDPALTYSITSGSVVLGDSFSGALSRDSGENVALYSITQGTLSLGSNYDLTVTAGVKFEIKKRPVTVTPDAAQFKIYGDSDPALTYSITNGSLVTGDSFSGALSRDPGSNVGLYNITQGTLSLGSNYDLTVTSGIKFEIKKRPVTVTPDSGQFKTYGASDPALTYSITSGSLVTGDSFSGTLTRDPGETVGLYNVTQGTLSLSSNYDLTLITGVKFEIKKAHLTVTADYKTKTYDAAPFTAFTATITGFVNGENSSVVSGSPAFTGSAVGAINAGTYVITPTLSTLSATNYDFTTFVNGTLKIKKADAVVTVSGYTAPYDGFAHGASGSVTGVDAGGAAIGTTLNPGASFTNYPGGVAYWTFSGGTNYNDQNGSVSIVINKVHLTETADNKSKTYNGSPFSPFTVTLSGFVNGENSSVVTGSPGFTGSAVGAFNAGTYTITPTAGILSALNYDFTMFINGTLTIGKVHLTVTADNKSVQYSDPLPTFTATLSGFVNGETDASLRFSGDLSGNASFTTAAAITFYSGTGGVSNAPGTYTNVIIPSLGTLSATNYDFTTFNKGTLTVTEEDARPYYTGPTFVNTSGPTSTMATVTLSATIKDITPVDPSASDPHPDNYQGVITNAKVTFINRDNNTVIASNVPVGLVNAGDSTVGTATYNWTVNISPNVSQQYTIGIIVTNYYTRNSSFDDDVVTVSVPPAAGSITGGGYLVMSNSAGLYPGGVGTKNNFGFNCQNTKSGVKGNINTIIRNNGRVYQIKGNSMTSLTTNPITSTTGTATFNGKANIQDITNPNAPPISIDGNATLQVSMADNGEPGSNDTISITVFNKSGGVWFTSNWNGTTYVQQKIGGGNLQVR